MFRAELIAQHPAMQLDRDIQPFSLQPSPRFFLRDGKVFALDDTLTVSTNRSVVLSSSAQLLCAAQDLSIIVAADQSDLVVVAGEKSRLPLPDAETACIFPGGDILVIAPITESFADEGLDYVHRNGFRVLLIGPDAGRILDEVILDIPDARVSATQHPIAPLTLLTAGQGQDGSRIFAVAEVDGRLQAKAFAENMIAASFNPAGTSVLITPHPSFSRVLQVLNWPDATLLNSATAVELGLTDDIFGFCGCYLNENRMLAMTAGGKLVVLNGQLGLLGEVTFPPGEERSDFMIGVSPENFAIQTWCDGAASALVWRLPPSPE